jgi:hypothetical protein
MKEEIKDAIKDLAMLVLPILGLPIMLGLYVHQVSEKEPVGHEMPYCELPDSVTEVWVQITAYHYKGQRFRFPNKRNIYIPAEMKMRIVDNKVVNDHFRMVGDANEQIYQFRGKRLFCFGNKLIKTDDADILTIMNEISN